MSKRQSAFQIAVTNTPDIAECYQPGLQGLGPHSNKIELSDTRQCSGSVDLDTCTTHKYSQENRWDYFFCYKNEVFFVEVHSANTGEVSTVSNKLQWLKDWLEREAPEIKKLKAKKNAFIWIQSKKFNIPRKSPQYLRVIQEGMKPIPRLKL